MRTVRSLIVVALAVTTLSVAGAASAGAAGTRALAPLTCNGGVITPGNYASVKITGVCAMPSGNYSIAGNVTVTAGAALIAISPAPATSAAEVFIAGNITVGKNALLGLGCSPRVGCKVTTHDVVHGNITAKGSLDVVVHSTKIFGSVSLSGGGGGVNCKTNPLLKSPNFSDFEDNAINGSVSIIGLRSCWLGSLRNVVHGNMLYQGNKLADPDAMEILTNTVWGNLACYSNSPAVHVGDSKGKPNKVSGHKLGQCKAKGI